MKDKNQSHKRLRIAIFSGSIPSTTFIEHLIESLSEFHDIYLFGTRSKKVSYPASTISIYATPKSHWRNLFVSFIRTVHLGLSNPSGLIKLIREVKTYKSTYSRWIWYTKFLPIILHRPDILHIQWAKNLEFYYFLKRDFKVRIILSLRGAHINYSPIVDPKLAETYGRLFPKLDGFHAVSEAIAK
ncbi:MAG: hypothetical protein KJO25_00745, partial [Bacteroidia bacterium]|nr:hypothetical protein [Bacteroidia bacterium]